MHALALLVPSAAVDWVSDLLADELEALSVCVEDADAGSDAEQPVFDEPGIAAGSGWRRARISALFADEAKATEAAAAAIAASAENELHVVSIEFVAEQDWIRVTQAQFGPCRIEHDFWVVPTWSEIPAGARQVIRLDPGRAFGTGTHPTTRMCLRWIAAHGAEGGVAWSRALDYGCGSGVLAIAAARFGAREIDAVDVDPAAIETTRANALENGVALRAGRPDEVAGRYELVVANILAAPLTLLAPLLASLVADDGWLVLSGILDRQVDDLRAAYAPWLSMQASAHDEGWALLVARRPAASRMA